MPCPKKREAKNCFQRWIRNPLLSFVEHRLLLFVCALLVPEYVLAWAIRQYLRAREIARDNEGELDTSKLNCYQCNSLLDRRWSMTHGFFIIMGGFHLFKHSSKEKSGTQSISQEDDDSLHPLLASDLTHDDIYSFAMPTEAEIKDKGKSDWLTKSLVLLQTSWFVMQCIARAIKHLPVTHLEIVTLAYAAMNFVIYVFWWNKPLNVNRPVRVFRKSDVEEAISEAPRLALEANGNHLDEMLMFIIGTQDDGVNLSHEDRVPRFWANTTGNDYLIADVIMLGVGICFGAIHCIAWHFSFPTHPELSIWRTSSITITAVPIYIPLMTGLSVWLLNMDFETANIIGGIAAILLFPAFILYILARVFTLALAFTSLRDLPPGAFDTVHWTTFIPHI